MFSFKQAVLAQNSDTQAKKQDDKATAKDTAGDDKASVVQTYMQSHPDVQAKIDKVHAMWAKNHNQPPQTGEALLYWPCRALLNRPCRALVN